MCVASVCVCVDVQCDQMCMQRDVCGVSACGIICEVLASEENHSLSGGSRTHLLFKHKQQLDAAQDELLGIF